MFIRIEFLMYSTLSLILCGLSTNYIHTLYNKYFNVIEKIKCLIKLSQKDVLRADTIF